MRDVRELLPCAHKVAGHARCVTKVRNNSSHHDHRPLDDRGQANRAVLILKNLLFFLYMGVLLACYRLRLSLNYEWERVSALYNNWVL